MPVVLDIGARAGERMEEQRQVELAGYLTPRDGEISMEEDPLVH